MGEPTGLNLDTVTDLLGAALDTFARMEADPLRIRGWFSVGAFSSPFVNLVRTQSLEPDFVVSAFRR